MMSRKPLADWQNTAQSAGWARKPVARAAGLGEHVRATDACADVAPDDQDCYPSLPLWPVRVSDGPFFLAAGRGGGVLAAFRQSRFLCFFPCGNALWMAAGNPPDRGNRCSRPSPLWQYFPRCFPAAWPMTPSAPLSGRALGPLRQMPRAMTCSWVPGPGLRRGCLSSKASLRLTWLGRVAKRSTKQRGRFSCSNPSQHLPCLSSLQVATARSIQIVPVLGRWVAGFSARLRTITLQKAPLQEAFWAPWRQIRACVANSIGRLSRPEDLIRAIRGNPRVAFSFARPGRGRTEHLWGDACSRRS